MAEEPKKKEEVNLSKLRDEQLAPVAREIFLALAARDDLVVGSSETITTEEAAAYYRGKYIDVVIPILIKHNIRIIDLDFLFQLIGQPINSIKDITMASFEMNRKLADSMLYGVSDIDELKISDLDSALKKLSKDRQDQLKKVAKDRSEKKKK